MRGKLIILMVRSLIHLKFPWTLPSAYRNNANTINYSLNVLNEIYAAGQPKHTYRNLIQTYGTKKCEQFDLISLCETWLQNNETMTIPDSSGKVKTGSQYQREQ